MLKIYIRDDGWAGSTIYVTDDEEEAKRVLFDDSIKYQTEKQEEHIRLYYDPKSSLYEPNRHNPYPPIIDNLKRRKENIVSHEIKKGLLIETEGDY